MDSHDRETDDAVALPQVLDFAIKRLLCDLQRREALILVNNKLFSDRCAQLLDQRHGPLFTTEMYLFGLNSKKRLRPGPPTLSISDHLNLINDSHVKRRI